MRLFYFQEFDAEVKGHQPSIDRVVATGAGLIKARHFAANQIEAKQSEVKDVWKSLLQHSDNRKDALNISLHKQKVNTKCSHTNTITKPLQRSNYI